MALTLSQVQTQLQAAWDAINAGELSFTVQGRTTQYHSLGEMQRHIDWLEGKERDLIKAASAAAGTGGYSPVVEYGESR